MKVYPVFWIDEHYCRVLYNIYLDEHVANEFVTMMDLAGDPNYSWEEWQAI